MASLALTEDQLEPPFVPADTSPVKKTSFSPAVFFTPPKRSSPAPFQSPNSYGFASTPRQYPPYTVQFGNRSKPLVSRSGVSPNPRGRKVVRCLESQFDDLDENPSILVSTQPEFYIQGHSSLNSSHQYHQISDTDKTNVSGSSSAFMPHDYSSTTSDKFSSTMQGPDLRNMNRHRSFPIMFEDLLSDSSTETESSTSENTMINASHLEPLQQIPLEELGHGDSESLQKVEEFHQRLLLRRGVRCLIRNVLVRREQTKIAIQHCQQRKLRVFFQMWRKKAGSRRRMRLQRALAVWKVRAVAQKRLQEVLLQKRHCVVAAYFTAWQDRFYRAMGAKKAVQHYQMKLRCRALRVWRNETQTEKVRMTQLVLRAEVFYGSRARERAFLVWRAWMLYRADCRNKASLLLGRVRLRLLFRNWKRLAHSQRRNRVQVDEFIQTNRKRALRGVLTLWKEEYCLREKFRRAKHTLSLRLKRNVFQAWRVYIYRCTLKKLCVVYLNQKTTALLQASFDHWVCSVSSLVGEGLLTSRLAAARCSGLLHSAFSAWLMAARLSKSFRAVRTTLERRMLSKHFQKWKASWSHLKSLKERGRELEKRKTKQLWNKWRAYSLHCKSERVAVQHHSLQCLKKAFFFWKAEHGRHTALHAVEASRERAALTSHFALWRAATGVSRDAAKTSLAQQLYHRRILRACLLYWRNYVRQRKAELGVCAEALQSAARKIRLASSFKCWRRQLQCQEIVRARLARRKEALVLNCFSSWKELTETSYEKTSQLFLAKLHLALAQSSASTATTRNCLHDISLNLGLEERVETLHVGRRTISSPHFQLHQAGRMSRVHTSPTRDFTVALLPVLPHPWLQPPSLLLESPVHSTPHPMTRISSEAYHVGSIIDTPHVTVNTLVESPAATRNRTTMAVNGRNDETALRNESDLAKNVKRKLFEKETTSPSEVSINDDSPSTITSKSSTVTASRQSESPSFTPVHTHRHHEAALSPTAVCSCVDPATTHQIKELQQELSNLSSEMLHSPSLLEATILGEPLLPSLQNPNDLSEPEVSDAFPILPPPPGFVMQNTDDPVRLQGDCETGHLQPELSPISSYSRSSGSFRYMTTRSLSPQIQHIRSSSTAELAIHRESFSPHTPSCEVLQRLRHTLKHMRLYPCSKLFQVWREYTEKQTALRKMFAQFEQSTRLQKMGDIFSTWKQQSSRLFHLRELEVRHHDRVNLSTLTTCLAIWKAQTQRKLADRETELQAISYHSSVCLKKHFVCWRIAYQSAIAETTTQLYHVQVMRRVFQRWRKVTSQRLLVRRLCRKWRHTARLRRQEKQAQAMGHYWALSSAWMRWRVVYIKQTVAVRGRERELLRQVFVAWRLATFTTTTL